MTSILLVVCLMIASTSVMSLSGDHLRVNGLFETTNWDLLEDLYLYHNAIRYYHGTSSLKFNRTLTDYARLKSLIYAWYDGQVPEDNGDIKFGENVHWYKSQEGANASDIIDNWYFDEEPKWNYDEPHVTSETQEFSQIIWNATQRFGCGQAVSKGSRGGTWTVCYYDPPGNTPGQEKVNVFQSEYDNESGEEEETSTQDSGSSSSSSDATTTSSALTTNAGASIRALVSSQRSLGRNLKHDFLF